MRIRRNYKSLSKPDFTNNNFKLIPIRDEDKYNILKWRNEQLYHLRQNKLLTNEIQELYVFMSMNEAISNTERYNASRDFVQVR